MPIISVAEAEARRRAARASARKPSAIVGATSHQSADPAPTDPDPEPRYEIGYGRPPKEHRFKKGHKGGPGRPKGSLSHDTLMRKHLEQKRKIRIEGREREVPQRELAVMIRFRQAIEDKNHRALEFLLNENARLYRDAELSEAQAADVSESDRLTLHEFREDMRLAILSELEGTLDEAGTECSSIPDRGTEE